MGRDKTSIQLKDSSLLALAKRESLKTKWPVRVLRKDAVKRCGPLGGVYTALKQSKADIVIFVACDMPFVSATQLKRVARALTAKSAAAFTKQNGYATFPFAIRKTALNQIAEQIETADFSLQTLARKLRAKFVRAKKSELFDIDTPDDLATAHKRLNS
jgi:molybdopterin-guanine dinucleotide biosynthesis protein A